MNPNLHPMRRLSRKSAEPQVARTRGVWLTALAIASCQALCAEANPRPAAPALVMDISGASAAEPAFAPAPASVRGRARAPALRASAAKPPDRVRIGASPGWSEKRFVYRADNKRLGDVLQDLAASQSLPAVVAEDLEGVVNGNFDVKIGVFLDSMARTYNLIWYHDGTALYFYPGRSIQSRMFRLKGFRRQQVQNLLQALDLGDKRYPIRYDEMQNALFVSGPPRHVELVTSAIETLDAGVAEAALRSVQVFPLRFATAGDRKTGGLTIVGVASTLRKLYAPVGGGDGGAVPAEVQSMLADGNVELADMEARTRRGFQSLPKLSQTKSPAIKPEQRNSLRAGQAVKGKVGAEQDDAPPLIEADEGTNSVVIQGRSDRMADYGALIQRLDQKPMLVELVATIIEVSSDSVDRLGINWSLKSAGGSGVSVAGPQGNADGLGQFTLGTVVANAGRELLARVDALQGEGKARIVSRPSVLGVANRTAVMHEKRIATVRVSGSRDANLFQVEAGTLLEMTPQISPADGSNRVKLSIYIEDGNFETTQIDQIPIVKKTEIRTEAHVREGESLLIAGISGESDRLQSNGVPGLSRVPVVGGLFRSTDNRIQRTERMFLITPRLPGLSAQATGVQELPTGMASKISSSASAPAPTAVAVGTNRGFFSKGEFASGNEIAR